MYYKYLRRREKYNNTKMRFFWETSMVSNPTTKEQNQGQYNHLTQKIKTKDI